MNFSSALAHNPLRILLTGGTGLVGRSLGQALVARGHQLTVLARASAELPYAARVFRWDGHTAVDPEALRGIEAIVHLAGESVARLWTPKRKKLLTQSRVTTAETLARSLHDSGGPPLKVWINASAVGFYGNGGDIELSEESPAGHDFLAQLCVEWEGTLWAHRNLSQRQVALRTGLVLARDGGALEPLVSLFRHRLGGRLGSGRQWMSWIHVEDLVQLFVWALENPSVKGPINAVSPNPVTNQEWTRTLAGVLQVPAIVPAPRWVLRLILGEMSAMLLTSQRVVPKAAAANGFQFAHPDLAPALTELVGPR